MHRILRILLQLLKTRLPLTRFPCALSNARTELAVSPTPTPLPRTLYPTTRSLQATLSLLGGITLRSSECCCCLPALLELRSGAELTESLSQRNAFKSHFRGSLLSQQLHLSRRTYHWYPRQRNPDRLGSLRVSSLARLLPSPSFPLTSLPPSLGTHKAPTPSPSPRLPTPSAFTMNEASTQSPRRATSMAPTRSSTLPSTRQQHTPHSQVVSLSSLSGHHRTRAAR